jgi:hypothetical protein
MRGRWARRAVKFFVVAVVIAGVLGLVVMSLWNWLVPTVFGVRPITFVQAIGLLVLSKILFGGFRGGPGFGRHWRHRMRERWERMTPEERERFRHGWHQPGRPAINTNDL